MYNKKSKNYLLFIKRHFDDLKIATFSKDKGRCALMSMLGSLVRKPDDLPPALCGDMFKFTYYAYKNAPLQFIGCALFQLCTDFFVIFQLWYYTKHYSNEIVPISASESIRNVPSSINNMTKTEISK